MRFLALAAVACVLAPGTRGSAVVVVPTDAPTLADAVATAADGDIIELLPGLYAGSGFRDIAPGAKALTVRSQSGDAADTILDLESSGGLFQTDRAMTLEGLTVRYGAAAIIGGSPAAAIVVRECRMELNAAVVASTIEASVSLIDSEFVDNGASIAFTDQGSLTVSGCSFTRNQGGVTGGDGLIDVTGSSFVDNVGAVNATSNTTLAVSSCTFSGGAGPAVSMGGSSTSGEIADCRFEGLETTARGAAIAYGNCDGPMVSSSVFVGCSAAIEGGAIFASSGLAPLRVEGCTFAENSAPLGSSISLFQSNAEIGSTIFAFGVGSPAIDVGLAADADLDCTDIFGNAGGDWVGPIAGQLGVFGNFSLDPLFCDLGVDDLRLDAMSPCLPGQHPTGFSCGLIGSEGEGCGVVDVTAPTTAIADFDVRPNPANRNVGFDLPGVSARADIDIFDSSGRRVRRLRVASGVAATWDLRGASGMPVAAGVYWARFRADGVSATRRVVVAR